jgi:hypothetical protein
LGVLGLSYLGVALFEPAWLGDLTPVSVRQSANTQNLVTGLSADVADLRSSVAKLQVDLASVKGDVTSQADQTRQLGTQLSALEDKVRLGQTTVASADAPPTAPDAAALAAASAAPAAATPQKVTAKPAVQPAKIINAAPAQPAPIVTGSVEPRGATAKAKAAQPDVISFGPAVVKAAPPAIGIEIASGPSVDGLRLSWSQISEHNDKLKKMQARYAENGDFQNPNFNLIAGPVKSKAEAARICKDLQAHYVTCKVSEFKGTEL